MTGSKSVGMPMVAVAAGSLAFLAAGGPAAYGQSSMASVIERASRHGPIEYRPVGTPRRPKRVDQHTTPDDNRMKPAAGRHAKGRGTPDPKNQARKNQDRKNQDRKNQARKNQDRKNQDRIAAARVSEGRSFFNRLNIFRGRTVTIAVNKSDLEKRDRLQARFFRELIWRYYGRKSWTTRALTKRLNRYYGGLIRTEVVRQIRSKHPSIYPFGFFVDGVVAKIAAAMAKTPDTITRYFSVTVPRRFFVARGRMRLELEVVKARVPRLDVYQWHGNRRQLVFRSLAAPGNARKNFGTPNGLLYTSRFIGSPRWYPCVTKWAKDEKCRQPRGINTAFGLGGMDLTRKNYLVGYGPKWGNGAVSSYLVHSTNSYASPGRYASHGCVRLFPHKADELFKAVVHYYRAGPMRTRDFGDIIPFAKTIPVMIGTPGQLAVYRRQLWVSRQQTAAGK